MESIVLQPLLQVVFEKLGSLALPNLVSFRGDKKRLEDQLLLIQSVIQDAEGRQVREERIRIWLSKLQSIVYDIDDLLDRIHVEDHRRITRLSLLDRVDVVEDHGRITRLKFLKKRFTSLKVHLVSPFNSIKISIEIKRIQETIGGLVSEIHLLNLVNDVRFRRYESWGRPQTGIFVNESEIVGLEQDKKMVIEMLLSTPSESIISRSASVPVLPIVGMGGIGKTTLAQLVYNDPHMEKHFDLRIWIAVGGDLNVRKLMKDILDYTDQKDAYGSHLPQLGLLQSRLQKSLCGRKYLLVLDDVWKEDESEWNNLIEPLGCGVVGSKILVTTRNRGIATLMGTYDSFYDLKPLGHDDSWTLFQQWAFPKGEEDAHLDLVEIGKNILNKCGGIPLAAKVLGSLLRFDRDKREWLSVLRSEVWNSRCNTILSVLRLTYDHLPPNQKRCFSYCSVFPKYYEINREGLIFQWIAEGLIPSSGGKKMEDIANVYFNDLVSVSLFEAVSYSEDGRISDFKVHNLIHDLARSVYETVVENVGHEEFFHCRAERRAYIVCNELSSTIYGRLSNEKLRTLQLISMGNDSTEIFRSVFKRRYVHIRVLKLSNCGITILHESVGNMIYLRYLDLSHNLMRKLPETICHLYMLQTLDLSSCRDLEELPNNIINLIELRSLNIEDCVGLSSMPSGIGTLRNLMTLPIFILGSTYGQSLNQLMQLDLRGKLKIKHLENVSLFLEEKSSRALNSRNSSLGRMELHTLSFSWGEDNKGNVDRNAQRQNLQGNLDPNSMGVLNCLAPNSYLRVLQIKEYPGTKLPNWFHLSNLTELI